MPRFCATVTNHLLRSDTEWEGIRTVGRLRFERGLKAPMKNDSVYQVICSKTKTFLKLLTVSHERSKIFC